MTTVQITEQQVQVSVTEQDFAVTAQPGVGVTVAPVVGQTVTASIGVAGPQGPQGEPGPAGAGARYVHDQATASADWTVSHGLGANPSAVTVVDTAGSVVLTEIRYVDVNTVRILSTSPFSGKAYLVT